MCKHSQPAYVNIRSYIYFLRKKAWKAKKIPSQKELELFKLCSRYAAKSCAFGVDIISSTGKLIPAKSKFKLCLRYSTVTWMIFSSIFSLHRNYITYNKVISNSPIQSVENVMALEISYIFLTFGHCMCTPWFIWFVLFGKELANLWNQLIQFSSAGKRMKEY